MRGSRFRRAIFGLATLSLVTLHVLTANRWLFSWDQRSGLLMCARGCVVIHVLKKPKSVAFGFVAGRPRTGYPTIWLPHYAVSNSRTVLLFPLWMPAALTAAATILPVRRRRTNVCPSCGYDMRGIGDAPCPECGKLKAHC